MGHSLLLCCCFYFISLSPLLTSALTDEQKAAVKEKFEEIGSQCINEFAVTEDDINNLRAKKMANGPNVPCFLACIFKKVGVINDQGLLSKEDAVDQAKSIFKDPEELKSIENYLHSCAHIEAKFARTASLQYNNLNISKDNLTLRLLVMGTRAVKELLSHISVCLTTKHSLVLTCS